MGCNCSKNRQPTGFAITPVPAEPEPSAYDLTLPNGEVQTFGSKLEAHAARVRAGGGTVTPR